MKKIYFVTFAILFGLSIYCIFNCDTESPMLSNLCLVLSIVSWFFAIYFLKAFVSYEEREERDYRIKSLMELFAVFITSINGVFAFYTVSVYFGFDLSFWKIIISLLISFLISSSICAFTSVPLVPDKDDHVIKNDSDDKSPDDRTKSVQQGRMEHGVYS